MNIKELLIPRSIGGTLSAIQYFSSKSPPSSIKGKAPLLISCHGFTGDKYEVERFPKVSKAFNQEGFDTLIFDFSGSGENPREVVTLSKQVRDLKDVHDWAEKQEYTWIALLGLSFGGLTSVAANLSDIKAMILWAPVLDYHETFENKNLNLFKALDNLWKRPLKLPTSGKGGKILVDKSFSEDLLKHDVKSLLKKQNIPTLIIQGTNDSVVKLETTRSAFKLFPRDDLHVLVEVEGATHDFNNKHLDQFIAISINWMTKIMNIAT